MPRVSPTGVTAWVSRAPPAPEIHRGRLLPTDEVPDRADIPAPAADPATSPADGPEAPTATAGSAGDGTALTAPTDGPREPTTRTSSSPVIVRPPDADRASSRA